MEKQELKSVLAIVFIFLVLAYIVYNGVGPWKGISTLRTEAAKLQTERVKLERSVNDAKALVGDLPRIKQERAALEVQLKEISKKLPSERESAEVLRAVESLAGKSGLTLAGVKRRAARIQELYAELPMEVGVGGGYHDLVRFADQLSQLDRLVTLSEMRIDRPAPVPQNQPLSAAAVAATPGTVKAQMVAVVFQALPEPAEPTPTAATPGAPLAATPAVAPAR